MAETLAPNLGLRHFHAALVANYAAMFHALVLTAETFPVSYGTKNTRAEESITLRLEGAIVNRLRFRYLSMRPLPDLFRGREGDTNGFKVRS